MLGPQVFTRKFAIWTHSRTRVEALINFRVDAGTLRKIIGRPQWQDASDDFGRISPLIRALTHGVQGAVAATGYYPLCAVLDGLPDEPSQILPAPRDININVDA